MYGELVPVGGGDPVPLLKRTLTIGRRDSNDIVLEFDSISGYHCQLNINFGYWYVKDMNSRNGVKVNNVRIEAEKRLDPGDVLSVAKHRFEVRYTPAELGAIGPPPDDEVTGGIFAKSLLERAGLARKKTVEEMEEDDNRLRKKLEREARAKAKQNPS